MKNDFSTEIDNKKTAKSFDWDLAMGLSAFAPEISLNLVVGVTKAYPARKKTQKSPQLHPLNNQKTLKHPNFEKESLTSLDL